jgi:ABC-type uncharacterized transport system substrate-binding protein
LNRTASQRALAADLVRLKIDAIVAGGSGDIRAAKEATATFPIVMVQGGDPVGSGFVASLARPWWKHYGIGTTLRPELSGKQLELLKEIVPKLSRVVVFAPRILRVPSKPQPRGGLRKLRTGSELVEGFRRSFSATC